ADMGDQLEIMDEAKEIAMIHNGEEPQEEVVEEEYMDGVIMMHDMPDDYVEEEVHGEEEDDDTYGGMPPHLYDAIVEFKRSGAYPDMADQRVDRSAHCHWRLRCGRFSMNEDGMTLMYGGENVHVDQPKYVIRKGEVKDVVERVHTLIGHVGTKRTQAALMKKLYWRSVRNDVKQFVTNCAFCQDKKIQGKKLSKAPIDIQSENFDLDVDVRYTNIPGQRILAIHLAGYDEDYVRQAAMTRMTSYTFRSTEHRKVYRTPSMFKRQPYFRRPRFDPQTPSGFLVPVLNGQSTREQQYMSVQTSSRGDEMAERLHGGADKTKYIDDMDDDEEEELTPVDPTVASPSRAASAASSGGGGAAAAATLAADMQEQLQQQPTPQRQRSAGRRSSVGKAKVYDVHHPAYRRSKTERAMKEERRQEREHGAALHGAASRLSGMFTQSALRGYPQSGGGGPSTSAASAAERHLIYGQSAGLVGHDVITSYEEARDRPELTLLPPVLLMPSNDPEVTMMQKELLTRQLDIQKLQMRVLQAHLEATRYEEVVVDGRDDVEELNVIDTEGY
ncbi:hypothetical protein PFISCL1PPCAC_8781, partial [Pristionchus fissidentatus]